MVNLGCETWFLNFGEFAQQVAIFKFRIREVSEDAYNKKIHTPLERT